LHGGFHGAPHDLIDIDQHRIDHFFDLRIGEEPVDRLLARRRAMGQRSEHE
jgi:hypothetical protein